MKIIQIIYLILMILSFSANAQPKFILEHQRNNNNLAEIQITNQTGEVLICSVAIDGHKIYFRLPGYQPSLWYNATDPRFNYKNFSVWCDYIYLYPKYQSEHDKYLF